MCSTWLINGRYCETGADLIEAIGIENAKRVNEMYDSVGEMAWKVGPNGERVEYTLTDDHVAEGCLCPVSPVRMKELTGQTWEYDLSHDAFVATA